MGAEARPFRPILVHSNGTPRIFHGDGLSLSEEDVMERGIPAGTVKHVMDDASLGDQPWPSEFICPISNLVMSDPVIVGSGQTYERRCIEAWFGLGQRTCVKQRAVLEHLFLIPNVALKTAIQNFARFNKLVVPDPPDAELSLLLAKRLVALEIEDNNTSNVEVNKVTPPPRVSDSLPVKALQEEEHNKFNKTDGGQVIPVSKFSHSASGQALKDANSGERGRDKSLPLPLATRPLSYSIQPQEEPLEEQNVRVSKIDSKVLENIVKQLQHIHALEIEQAARELRQLTRQSEEMRKGLCQQELLSVLLPHLKSRYAGIQVISTAAIVNLSLANENKVKIVRAGAVPFLIDVLKSGHPEAQGHAAGAIFSLALDEENKIAIGVLGAISPLIHLLRTGPLGARQDAAMALYHLSHARSNRAKLVKVGAVPILLNLAQEERGDLACRALLILCNIAATANGRTIMLELNAITTLTKLLGPVHSDQTHSSKSVEEIREHAAAVLLVLSQSTFGIRFKSLMIEAGALDAIVSLSEHGTPRAREKALALLAILKETSGNSESSWMYGRSLGRFQQSGLNSS